MVMVLSSLSLLLLVSVCSGQWSDPDVLPQPPRRYSNAKAVGKNGTASHSPNSTNSAAPYQPTATQVRNAPKGVYGTPAKTSFDYKRRKVYGVSLGGWLVLEPFITPSIFDATGSDDVVDEWTLSDYYGGGKKAQKVLQKHWSTFYTAKDFKAIAAAGFNHVRIPVGFWSLSVAPGEPFAQGQFPYLQQAVQWAKQNKLSVIIDLHGAPGSQNGYDNSGLRTLDYGWADSKTNVQRTLNVVSQLAAEFRKPVYGNAVVGIEPLNEPVRLWQGCDQRTQKASTFEPTFFDFLDRAYPLIHQGTMNMQQHHAYLGQNSNYSTWDRFMPRNSKFPDLILTDHYYAIWNSRTLGQSDDSRIAKVCSLASTYKQMSRYHSVMVAEWTSALTDCAKYVRGRGRGSNYDGSMSGSGPAIGSCDGLSGDASTFSAAYKERLGRFAEAQMRTFESSTLGSLMWLWKTEDGQAEDWSVQKGLAYGWLPRPGGRYRYPDPCANAIVAAPVTVSKSSRHA